MDVFFRLYITYMRFFMNIHSQMNAQKAFVLCLFLTVFFVCLLVLGFNVSLTLFQSYCDGLTVCVGLVTSEVEKTKCAAY